MRRVRTKGEIGAFGNDEKIEVGGPGNGRGMG